MVDRALEMKEKNCQVIAVSNAIISSQITIT